MELYSISILSICCQFSSSVEISDEEAKPVDNFQERKQTEPEEETEQAAHRWDVVHQTHLQTSLVLRI